MSNRACACVEWSTWLDVMPPAAPRLHVSGRASCPTTGYILELVPLVQIPESTDLRLELKERPSSGIAGQAFTNTPFAYTRDARRGQFTTVTIDGCGTQTIRIAS